MCQQMDASVVNEHMAFAFERLQDFWMQALVASLHLLLMKDADWPREPMISRDDQLNNTSTIPVPMPLSIPNFGLMGTFGEIWGTSVL